MDKNKWAAGVAALVVDALVESSIIDPSNFDKACEIAAEEIASRLHLKRKSYWQGVKDILVISFDKTNKEAKKSIKAYRKALKKDGVKDEIYHAAVEETANGIVNGEY